MKLFTNFQLILLAMMCLFLKAQNLPTSIDSLQQIVKTQQGDSLVSTLNELSWEFKNSNQDSAVFYAKKALKLSLKHSYKKGIASSLNSIASVFQANGKLDSALVYHGRSLQIRLQEKDSIGVADSYNNLGIVYDEQGNYATSLEHYFKALSIYENNQGDFSKIAMVLGNIGIVHKKLNEYTKTLSYYQRALKIYEDNNHEVGVVITKGNLSALQLQLKNYESAIIYATQAKKDYEKLGYIRYVPYTLFNRAIALDSLKKHKEAKIDYQDAIAYFLRDQNLYELASAKIGLGQNQLYRNKKQEALQTFKDALEITKINGFAEFEVKAYLYIAKAHAQLNNSKAAYSYQKQYQKAKDSLFEAKKVEKIFELETKYQTEKKEKEIIKQRVALAEKEIEVTKKNKKFNASLGLAILLGLLGYLFYNQQKLKNQQLTKEGELKTALARIETQNKLQEQRLRISRDLHDNIGSQLTFVTSSVDNLKYGLKDANENITTKLGTISDFTTQTIYELRDTIWAMNKTEISFEDLQARISNFINNAGALAETTEFTFHVSEAINTEKTYSSIVGMNIYRVIQEAVNNALKYAKANKISVNIEPVTNSKKINISIVDNGVGFDVENAALGNGLQNMKKRAKDVQGTLLITAEKNNGTRIELVLK